MKLRGLIFPVALFVLALLVLDVAPVGAFERYNAVTKFDRYFSKYSKRYFGVGFDWRHFKAQAIAESSLQVDARSSAGARGVMQIMPRTFEEIRRKNPTIKGGLEQPKWNIAAGIWYDRQNFDAWVAERTLLERIKFMFGSYNAGRGSILRAQRVARTEGLNPIEWASIAQTLPRVTGRRSRETVAYVTRILEIKEVLR